jgi:hypothetical protein
MALGDNVSGITPALEAPDPLKGLPLSEGVRVFLLVVGSLLVVMGVFGNALILLTLSTQRSLRSLHHMYVVNLAVCDLISIAYVLPYWLAGIATGRMPVASLLHCQVNAFIMSLCVYSSIYTLVLIGFNR